VKWKPYPAYKPSGVEWLGDVPAHWDAGCLRRFALMRTGHTPSRSEPTFWEDTQIPWFTLADVWQLREGRRYLGETTERISALGLANSAAELLPAGTVVLSRTASVGFAGIMPAPMATSQDFWNWVPGERLRSEYLHYVFLSMRNELQRLTMGSTHKTIYQPDAARLAVPAPPRAEQQSIVEFLDAAASKVDALLAKKRALIERLREKRTALISRTVTRGLPPEAARAAGLAPHPKLKPSGIPWLGDIPEHWEVAKLGHEVTIGNGSTPQRDNEDYWLGGTYPWLTSTVVNHETVTAAEERVTDQALRECHLPRIPPPAVLVGITGEGRTRGMATLLLIEATINQHIAFLKPRGDSFDIRFLRRLFDHAYLYLRNESDGGGSTKGAITCEQLAALRLPRPRLPEQQAIAAYLDRETARIDALIEKVEAAIERLQEYRQALITAAVTGKIDVRDPAPPEALAPQA
jgi:type I restriction enzyme S subunit